MKLGPLSRVLAAGALAVGLLGVPGSLLATLSPLELVDQYGLGPDLRRLNEVRERLTRRRAWQRAIAAQNERLADEIEALRAEREAVSITLRAAADEVAALERRLDRLVPRAVAREAALRERRERAARTLADLANRSRRIHLDPLVRARMLAVSPLMLKRLERSERVVARRNDPESTIERHQRLEQRWPHLLAKRQRLESRREQKQRVHRVSLARLAELDAEIRLLGREQERLAARFLAVERAHAARAEPDADQPAVPDRAFEVRPADRRSHAAIKGTIDAPPEAGENARDRAPSQIVAALAPSSAPDVDVDVAATRARTVLPPPAKPVSVALRGAVRRGDNAPSREGASQRAVRAATPLDVVFVPGGALTPRARTEVSPGPIMPIPHPSADRQIEQGDELSIVAAPGQAVAAPVAGRVVFAGPFKSYGQLLIIEHEREYHTLLWGFARLRVAVGDQLEVGQIVGQMDAGAGDSPVLHVERRRNGHPVDLAASNGRVQG